MATATTNGDDTPPFHPIPPVSDLDHAVSNKRKREASSHESTPAGRAKLVQPDILEVLQRHDTEPSFLQHPLSQVTTNEPSPKKARLSGPFSTTATIAAKLSSSSYSALQHVKADAMYVSDALIAAIRKSAQEKEAGRPSMEQLKQISRIQMVESLLKDIVDKEDALSRARDDSRVDLEEEDGGKNVVPAKVDRPGTVLTLFGNAPTPKQLFSSTQHPHTGRTKPFVKSELPVEEMSLPNGITATKVMPVSTDARRGPTFEEAFAPPYNLPTLQPPKVHKRSSARDKDVTWEYKDPVQRNKRGGYTVQPLTVGSWLNYGSADAMDTNLTRERRKERTRALSSSADTAERPNQDLLDETLAREEEALFRRAYSSFAPTCDNSNAVVPTEIRSMVWWHKVGHKRYDATFAIDPALVDESEQAIPRAPAPTEEELKDIDLSNIVEDLEQFDNIEPDPEPAKSKTQIEQVLRDISALLETLASHQRIRNATLPPPSSAARTPISPAPVIASMCGKPDQPSEEELATYNSLRRELAYLILKLPPYAVAKLNGDQMEELGVSKLITFEAKDTKGVMEEDQVTRQAKLTAIATASSIANLARPNSSAGQHYSATANRTPAIGQAANTRYGQQYGTGTPATAPQFSRQMSNPQSYGTPNATAPRPNYGHSGQWTKPGAIQSNFGTPNTSQYSQRPQPTPVGYSSYRSYQQRFPQVQPPQPSRTGSHVAVVSAAAYQTQTPPQQALNRTVSPVKGFPAVAMAPTPQHRPIYQAQPQQQPGSGRATPNNYPSQPHTPVNGFAPPPQQRQPQGIAPRPTSSTPQPQLQPQPYQPPGSIQTQGST